MGNNIYNKIKDILTDIFEEIESDAIVEIDKKYEKIKELNKTLDKSDVLLWDSQKNIVHIACQTARNHTLNEFETIYKDCKILLKNL